MPQTLEAAISFLETEEADHLKTMRAFARELARGDRLEIELLSIQDQERARIGRELHDDICQQLTAIRMLLHLLSMKFAARAGDRELVQNTEEIDQALIDATNAARDMARELTPIDPNQTQDSLCATLHGLAARTAAHFHLECVVHCPPALVLNHETAVQVHRIAQEAVTNACHHSGAQHIEIRFSPWTDGWRLCVADDGVGIHKKGPDHAGIGLRTMMYRAAILGGVLEVRPGKGSPERPGTMVCFTFVAR